MGGSAIGRQQRYGPYNLQAGSRAMASIATGRQQRYDPYSLQAGSSASGFYSESETVQNRGVAEAFLGVNS